MPISSATLATAARRWPTPSAKWWVGAWLHQRLMNSAGGSANRDRKSTRLNSSPRCISYAVFCLKNEELTAGQWNYTKLNKTTLRNEALRNGWKLISDVWICKGCFENDLEKCL